MKVGNFKKEELLNFFRRHAPQAPFRQCMYLAEAFAQNEEDLFRLKEAVAILAEEGMGFTKNGEPPQHLMAKSLAVRWALQQAINCHGWVVCGCGPGMEGLVKEIEEDIKTKKLFYQRTKFDK